MPPTRRQALLAMAGLAAPLTLGTAFQAANVAAQAPVQKDTIVFHAAAQASTEPGVVVCGVQPDSPAAKAGVLRGDVLLRVNGDAVNTFFDLHRAMANRKAGDQLALALTRGGDARSVSATLAEKDGRPFLGLLPCGPALPLPGEGVAGFRVLVRDGEGPLAVSLPEGVTQGAILTDVAAGGPAAGAGLKQGEVVTRVDGQELTQPRGLAEAIAARKPGDTVTLTVHGPGSSEGREVRVQLGTHPDKAGTAYLGVHAGWMMIKRVERRGEASEDALVTAPTFQIELPSPDTRPARPLPPPAERI